MVGEPTHIRHDHLLGQSGGEEGLLLGTPVIMEEHGVHIGIGLHDLVEDADIQIGQLVEESGHVVLAVFIGQSHDGAFELHQSDQSLIETGLEPDLVEVFLLQILVVVQSGGTGPIPGFDVGPDNLLAPLGDVLQEGMAGTDHAAADGLDVFPFHTEHILAAAFFHGVEGSAFEHEAASHVVGNDAGSEDGSIGGLRTLPPGLAGEHGHAMVMLVQGVVENLHGSAAEAGDFLVLQLFGIEFGNHCCFLAFAYLCLDRCSGPVCSPS